MEHVPECIDVGNLVGKKLDDIENDGSAYDDVVVEHLELRRQRDPVIPRGKAQYGNRRIQVHSCRKREPEGAAERRQVHNGINTRPQRGIAATKHAALCSPVFSGDTNAFAIVLKDRLYALLSLA